MKIERLVERFALTIGVLALSGLGSAASAQSHDSHGVAPKTSQQQSHRRNEGQLVKEVKEATKDFADVDAAIEQDYQLLFGCVSGGDFGAMGLHYVNLGKVFDDGKLSVDDPEIVLYEPTRNGGVRITGADYLVIAADWHKYNAAPPELMGQLFHFFDSPNRFGLDPFYTLHVWAWKNNPAGTFGNWNPDVSCDAFAPEPASSTR